MTDDLFPPVAPLPTRIFRTAAVIRVRDAEGRVMMQLRDDRPGVIAAGQWSLFGGGLEKGEKPAEAALREFHEETGIVLRHADIHPWAAIPSTRPDGVIYVFDCSLPLEPSALRCLGEGAGFAFLTPQQIADWPLPPHLRTLLMRGA